MRRCSRRSVVSMPADLATVALGKSSGHPGRPIWHVSQLMRLFWISSITVAPAVASALSLVNRSRRCELFDANGRQATLYRKVRNAKYGHLLYIRRGLL